MGFSKEEITSVEKLYRSHETGYTRYIDPKAFPKGSDANVIIRTWGFVDIGKDGFVHILLPY